MFDWRKSPGNGAFFVSQFCKQEGFLVHASDSFAELYHPLVSSGSGPLSFQGSIFVAKSHTISKLDLVGKTNANTIRSYLVP